MVKRRFWIEQIEKAWAEYPVVWLRGVPGSGKTSLMEQIQNQEAQYIDCHLQRIKERFAIPGDFLRANPQPIQLLDGIDQVKHGDEILKKAIEEHSERKLLVTASDPAFIPRTIPNRYHTIHIDHILESEMEGFNIVLQQRLFLGGLPLAFKDSPPFPSGAPLAFNGNRKNPRFYQNWMELFFAREIQRNFGFRDMDRFNRVFEYVLQHSGQPFEGVQAAVALGTTRPTIGSHIQALETMSGLTVIRPFHGNYPKELVKIPRIYAFDTGFVSFARGWENLRQEDCLLLWRHLVLEELQARFPTEAIQYWGDKTGRDLDFVMPRADRSVDVFSCAWERDRYDSSALKIFRQHYPQGCNYLLVPSGESRGIQQIGTLELRVCTPGDLNSRIAEDRVMTPQKKTEDRPVWHREPEMDVWLL